MSGLIPLDLFTGDAPIVIDLVYAQENHADNQFPGLYHPKARLFAHLRLVPVILKAAQLAHARHGWRLKLNDCFRPVEAQAKMAVYGFPPELVSRPGRGAHPRGMAIDIEPLNEDDDLLPMGTAFDFFASDLAQNPASRSWTDFGPPAMSAQILQNRRKLDACLFDAATHCGETLVGLADEWWDYRFPRDVWESYPALAEADLPACCHCTVAPVEPDAVTQALWQHQREEILTALR